jgi:enterobactin synthetase component F
MNSRDRSCIVSRVGSPRLYERSIVRLTASEQLRSIGRDDPTRPAIMLRDATWTYQELDREVDRLATWLLERTAGRRMVVLRFKATVPLIVSSLAVARAGLVTATLDPMAPPARVQLLLEDLRTDESLVLLTDQATDVEQFEDAYLYEDLPTDVVPRHDLMHELDVDDLMGIVYTSGSTGDPVGLELNGWQRVAVDSWANDLSALTDHARIGILGVGTIGQSAEFVRLVIRAGATILLHEVLAEGLETIPRWLLTERVEAVALVPTLLRFLLPLLADELGDGGTLPALTTLALWGEQPDWESVHRLARHLDPSATVFNMYGTTETGAVAGLSVTAAEILGDEAKTGNLSAGRPSAGVRIRIVDPHGDDVPNGEVGEILVASPYLARGHWHRPHLTRAAQVTHEGATFWRTGDGGFLDHEGMLHVRGRLDDVVKISGHRVSLGELEQAARTQGGVTAAAAAARPDHEGVLRLQLFVVVDQPVDPRWMRAELARLLPPAALPDTIDVVDALPTLSNGKLNRRDLPEPAISAPTSNPGGGLVDRVALLFSEVLQHPVGPHDNFTECGGDSIRAGRLVGLLQTQLGYYVPASLLLEAPTPAMIAAALESSEPSILVPIRTSGAQAPLFVIHGAAGDVWFARPMAMHLEGWPVYAIQPPPLVGPTPFVPTLAMVAERYLHEILRVRPHGPYRLFGYSMGGVIAFEIATLLQARGEEVDLLALGDSYTPAMSVELWDEHEALRRADRAADLASRNVAHLARRAVTHVRWRLRTARDKSMWREFLAGREPDPKIRAAAYSHVYGDLLKRHQVSTSFRGELTLVAAAYAPGPEDRGWAAHVDGVVRVVPFDTSHTDLIVEPNLLDLCAALDRVSAG